MKRLIILAVFCAVLLAACGSTVTRTVTKTAPPTLTFKEPNETACITRPPPAGGECVREAEPKNLTLTAPLKAPAHQQCADWSQWQGYYPETSGLSCVMIQAAYGENTEPSVYEQIRDAVQHGVPYGVYDFGEPGVSGAYELETIRRLAPRASLGYWFDAEVSGVFWRSCEFTSEAQNEGLKIFGVFSYPGGYVAGGGTHCAGYLWASEWGVSGPSPFGGYPSSAIKLWQYSGHGDRGGVETDLDLNEGLIELGKPAPPPKPKPKPKPSRKQLKKQLTSDLALRIVLRALEARHNCRNPPYHHPMPDNRAYEHACWGAWVPQGRAVDNQIATIEKELR